MITDEVAWMTATTWLYKVIENQPNLTTPLTPDAAHGTRIADYIIALHAGLMAYAKKQPN